MYAASKHGTYILASHAKDGKESRFPGIYA